LPRFAGAVNHDAMEVVAPLAEILRQRQPLAPPGDVRTN
jgi:hypothetical protein